MRADFLPVAGQRSAYLPVAPTKNKQILHKASRITPGENFKPFVAELSKSIFL
jgi:hypothetical protein